MRFLCRFVFVLVGGFTAGLVLAAPSVHTYPLDAGFGLGPVQASDIAAAAAGSIAAALTAVTCRRRPAVMTAAVIGAAGVMIVALPGAWRFDMYLSAVGAGLLLGSLAVCCEPQQGPRQSALAGAVVAGLLTAAPIAQYQAFSATPSRYAEYVEASVQPADAVWLILAAATVLTAGAAWMAGGTDATTAASHSRNERELLVGIGVPAVVVSLYWSFDRAVVSLSTHGVEEGRWLLGWVAVPVTIAAALWLRERTGIVLVAALAVAVVTGGAISWSPGPWPVLMVPLLLVAAGAWLGRRRPMPLVGVGVLAVVAVSALWEHSSWDVVHFVAMLLVVPFVAAYTIVGSLPSTAPVTATSLSLPAVMGLPLIAQFGWTAYTPLTADPAGWEPSSWMSWSVGVSVAAVLACGGAMAWLRYRRPSAEAGI